MVRSRAGGLVPRARAALLEAGLGVRGLAVITITPGDAGLGAARSGEAGDAATGRPMRVAATAAPTTSAMSCWPR